MFRALGVVFMCLIIDFAIAEENDSDEDRSSTLKHVQLMWRGGLHALDYKTAFPYLPSIFPDPLAELTRKGKRQMYDLGRRIRERYGSLWNYTYNPYEHRIISGNINRTQTSGLLFAAGLFPPTQEYENFTDGQLGEWQPVPVHEDIRHSHTGTMLLGLRDECPAMWFVKQSQQYRDLNKKYEQLINFLCVNAGTPKADLHNAFLVATSLAVYFHYNASQFMWANTTIMERSIQLYWDIEDWLASIPEIRRLSAGWLLQVIIEELWAVERQQSHRRLVGYSSHDDNVASLTSTIIGSLPSGFPDYGDYIAIELHTANSTEYIEIWRSAQSEDSFGETRMDIQGCPHPCTLEKFDKWARYFIPIDWLAECYGTWTEQYLHHELPGAHSTPIGILIGFNALLLVLSITMTVFTCKYRREMGVSKKRKPQDTNLNDYERIEPN